MDLIEQPALHSPSVGSVVKKMMSINPDLDVNTIIELVRKTTRRLPGQTVDVVDEALALDLARKTLN